MRTALWILPLLLGCDPWQEWTRPHGGPCNEGRRCVVASVPARPQADLLFVIDNSSAMWSKQQHFLREAPALFAELDRLGLSYRVGVTSSDVGTWPAGKTVSGGFPYNCGSESGDDGALLSATCPTRTMGREAQAACQALCPDPSLIPQGAPYLSREGVSSNVPGDAEDRLGRAFRCIAMLGDQGCNIEGPLEGMRRALDGHRNAGFLRPGAALGVFLLTDEDDCSVSVREENDPLTALSCLGQSGAVDYRCFNPDFRCLARSVQCNEPLTTTGPKSGCAERPSSYLFPAADYSAFLAQLRPADKLFVAGLWPPPLGSADARMVVGVDFGRDPNQTWSFNRPLVPPDASCANITVDPTVQGRPQLRLNHFLQGVPHRAEASICAPQDWAALMPRLADQVALRALACLPYTPLLQEGRALCLVTEGDGPAMPACGAGCCAALASPGDAPITAACAAEAQAPCYCASPGGAACSGGFLAAVWRSAPAAATETRFACEVN